MERRYAFFETGRGCLAGLAACVGVAIMAVLVFLHLPVPGWAQFLIVTASATPLLWLAFRLDRPRDR